MSSSMVIEGGGGHVFSLRLPTIITATITSALILLWTLILLQTLILFYALIVFCVLVPLTIDLEKVKGFPFLALKS